MCWVGLLFSQTCQIWIQEKFTKKMGHSIANCWSSAEITPVHIARYKDSILRNLAALQQLKPPFLVNVGLPRTGTQSFVTAAERLGFSTAHIGFGQYSTEALEQFSKKGSGPICGFLLSYDVLADSPYYGIIEDLLRAFPSTRLVYSTRPKEDWLRSMARNPIAGGDFLRQAFGVATHPKDDLTNLETIWRKHAEIVDAHNIPCIDLDSEDPQKWKVLSDLLGVSPPKEPWPHMDKIGSHLRNDCQNHRITFLKSASWVYRYLYRKD